jgi:DNA (cytosine-5)-methyltransferase 1
MSQRTVAQNRASRSRTPQSAAVAAELKDLREHLCLSQAELANRLHYSVKTIARWESGRIAPKPVVLDYVRGLARGARTEAPHDTCKFVDLFAGIGGLRRAFESVGGKCIFTSERDRHAQQTYRANFDVMHPLAGDIVQIPASAIPTHDLLLAGFPCQPFSIAGVSKKNALGRPHGFDCDTQGTLFFEVERILRHHRPKAFLLENVKNLTTHDQGRTFAVIRRVLSEGLGYDIHAMVLNARRVVPQHRERIFIVGFREAVDFDWSLLDLPATENGPTLGTILHPEDGSEEPEPPYTDARGHVNAKYILSEHLWSYLKEYAEKHRLQGNGFGFGLFGPDDVARTLSARYFKDGSEILIRRRRGPPRRLTPRECARLMGFDRPGQPRFQIPVSDTQAYRQFGNSVAVPVVEAVARLMKPHILGTEASREQLSLPLVSALV